MIDISKSYRAAVGLNVPSADMEKKNIIGFQYLVELQNESKETLEIFLENEYQIGDIVLDTDKTGQHVEILRKRAVKRS